MAKQADDPLAAGRRSAAEPSLAEIKADIRETRARIAATFEETTRRLPLLSGRHVDRDAARRERPPVVGTSTRTLVTAAVVGLAVFSSVRRHRSSSRRTSRSRRPLAIDGISAVVFDVDGTLIDSNAAHAATWATALSEHGFRCRPEDVRPFVGMGADKLLPKIAGIAEGSEPGQSIAKRKKALFAEYLPHLRPTPGARALMSYLRELKKDIVIATSADEEEMVGLLERANVADLISLRTSKDDAEHSKPDPDIVRSALSRAGSPRATTVMIGDTPYDIEAARRAGIDAIALRCGGYWSDARLRRAAAIFDNPVDLLAYWRPVQP